MGLYAERRIMLPMFVLLAILIAGIGAASAIDANLTASEYIL